MSLVILTKSPVINFSDLLLRVKRAVKYILGQKRGPILVTQSLCKGLSKIDYKYLYNPSEKKIKSDDVVYINESPEALKWAIEAKKKNKIKKIIAGPAIVVLPEEENSLLQADAIDIILVPSQWVKDLWISHAPSVSNKIRIWPAGVDKYEFIDDNKNSIFIYEKNNNFNLAKQVINFLEKNEYDFFVLKYGTYKHKKYLQLLDKSCAMIYISNSESQGLSLCEAWMKDVPTLVWSRGYWEYKGLKWDNEKISAPYLTEQCGMFFKNFDEFKTRFSDFIKNLDVYTPREYALNNFTNRISAKKFLEILNKL